ncbi:glycerophosphodiester phosphodiesterase [Schlesneria paludicola]|uniref:glycerophosphodiester phosphodiesterase n=1 Tax=Schlesneria paludicola TaxID=360056 RepID=UPI0002D85C49|nr:glycerophosphodiester phosphodiesterase [Schlesneria paludicola]
MILLRLLAFGLIMVTPVVAQAQKIVAHRGASFDAPENTLASFRLAWEQNADAIEGDFFLTKDQQIVCIHDSKTKRTSGVEQVVSESTLEELRKLDVGSWKDPRFKGEKIPTLAEVLAIIPTGKRIYIEIKCGPEIVPFLGRAIKQSGLAPEQTIVISFNDKVIAATREQIPEIKAYWLAGFRQNAQTKVLEPTGQELLATALKVHAHGIDIQAQREMVNADFVTLLRKNRLEFHVWTVNSPDDARHFQQLGVDSITTDRPAFLRSELQLK